MAFLNAKSVMQRMEKVILMNKEKLLIWGREFEIEIKYDCYAGEEVLENQKDALKAFLKSKENIEESLEMVKNYCLAQNKKDIGEKEISNIFKYVIPKYLYVVRNIDEHIIAIMCNYKFDQENGIAVVFENEKCQKIGKQDVIL